jgi:hypothetical protein
MNPRIEDIARRIVDLELSDKSRADVRALMRAIFDGLDDQVREAVIRRAIEIERAEIEEEADKAAILVRLLKATGCPDGKDPVAWLLDAGLIEPDDGGYRLTAKAVTRAV